MQNKSRGKQDTCTDTEKQTPKHEPSATKSLPKKEKKQRSEAAPLTLLALHLYSQTSLSKLSLHCSVVARVGYNTYNNCQTGLVSFFKIVRVKVFVFWGGCGIAIEAYTCLYFYPHDTMTLSKEESTVWYHKKGFPALTVVRFGGLEAKWSVFLFCF